VAAAAIRLIRVRWISQGRSDLGRLYEFLAPVNRQAAARAVQSLRAAPARLLRDNPRFGPRLAAFAPREVRRLFVGDYELRYESRATRSSSCDSGTHVRPVDSRSCLVGRQRRIASEAESLALAHVPAAAGGTVTEVQADTWIDSLRTDHEMRAGATRS
jgi:plasmid stabilization system protein ParE